MVWVLRQRGVADLLYLGMVSQKFHHLLGILYMALYAQREGLHALQQQEGGKGRNAGAGIPQQNRPDIGDERRLSSRLDKGHSVIAGIWFGNGRILARGRPVEGPGIYDDAAQRGSVSAEELGCGVNNQIRAVLNGPDQVRCTKGIIHHQRQAVAVCQFSQRIDVGNIAVGISQGFNIDGPGVWLNSALHLVQVVDIHKAGGDAEIGQRMSQQIIAASVDGLLRHDVPPIQCQGLNRIGNSGCAGGQRQGGYTALQGRDPLLQHILGGVCQSAIDVSAFLQVKPGRGMGAVLKHIRRSGINRDRPGVRRRVGSLLSHMQLERLKSVIVHCHPFLSFCVVGVHLFINTDTFAQNESWL